MRDRPDRKARFRRPPRVEEPREEELLIWGTHAVEAALANPERAVRKLWLTENAAHRMAEALGARGLSAEHVSPKDLDRRLGPDTVHQGALIEVEPLPEPDLERLAEAAETTGPLVVLDQVTDPHNVGAILRSAAAFGSGGLVMTRRHSPPLGGALAKAASGALEVVPIALVQNLSRALAELGELAFTTIGLDGGAEEMLEDQPLTGRVALVMGAEGKGLRQLTRESCTRLARIATPGAFGSLNVSNAAAVSLHLAAMARRGAGTTRTNESAGCGGRFPGAASGAGTCRSAQSAVSGGRRAMSRADGRAMAAILAAAAHVVAEAIVVAGATGPVAFTRALVAGGRPVVGALARMGVGAEHAEADNAGSDAGGNASTTPRLGRLGGRQGGTRSERDRQSYGHQLLEH